MFLLLLLTLIDGKLMDVCKQNMDTLLVKGNDYVIVGIHFCVSDHHQGKEARSQVFQDSVSQNKVKAIVSELQNLVDENPFQYNDMTLYVNIDEIHITGGLIDHSQNVTIVNQMLRVSKHIYFRNLISKELMITNIFTSSQYLKVDFEKIVLPSNSTSQKTRIFTIIYESPLSDLNPKTFEMWIAVEIAYFFRVPIKLIVYDKHLVCQVKQTGQCSIAGPHTTIDFQNIGIYQQYTKTFSLYNPNPVKIDVSYKQQERRKNQIRILLVNRNDIKSASKRKFSFEIAPFTRIELKAIINTNYYETLSEAILTFNTQFEFIDLRVNYSVQKGSVNYYPSVITLDPSAAAKVQQLDVYARSNFNSHIQLLQIQNEQVKHQNISLLTMATNIPPLLRQDILHIDYVGRSNFHADSKYHKQQAKELLHSFGRNKIVVQTDVLQEYEILINYKTLQKSTEQVLKKLLKQDLKNFPQPKKMPIQEQPNFFVIGISIANMIYLATLLRNSSKKSKEFKLVIEGSLLQEQIDLQSIFKYSEATPQQSKSETNEVVSDNTELESLPNPPEELIHRQSQIEESSSHFSQGESLDQDDISELHEKVVEENNVSNQKNFNLFRRVEFFIPTNQNLQPTQECWDTKDPIFLPHDSDEDILDKNSVQKLETLQNQMQHKLPQLEQSTFKMPLKWNDQFYPRPPPGI